MKVIEICNLPNYGGTKTYVSSLVGGFLKEGYEVVLMGGDGGISKRIHHENYERIKIDAKGKQARFLLGLFVRLMRARHLNKESNIVIHTHQLDEALLASLILNQCPIVCTLHGKKLLNVEQRSSKFKTMLYEGIERQSIRRLLKRRSVIVAVDESTRDHYYRRYSWAEDRVEAIPVGVDLQVFRPLDRKEKRERNGFDQDEQIVMYAGRLAHEKNLLFLIEAFYLLRKDIANVRLVLVGAGMEKVTIEESIKRLGVHDSVLFYGEADYEDMPELINCADVVVLCSLHEGSPHVIREAIACEVPIVATDVGDTLKLVNDYCIGFLSKYDEEDFAQNIARALNVRVLPEDPQRERLKRRISADMMTERYINIFQNIIYSRISRRIG